MTRPSVAQGGIRQIGPKAIFGLIVFAVLAIAITSQVAKRLTDFDQSFYITIAYDIDRHHTFSNGIFDSVDSTRASPPPGLFFGPLYPVLVLAAMRADARFAAAVACAVESNQGHRDGAGCEAYARPVHLMHALLLTLAVLAIAGAAQLLFGSGAAFYLAGALATAGLLPEADLFSFVMTESLTIAVYSIAAFALVLGWRSGRADAWLFAGLMFGVLTLTRPSFLLLAPIAAAMILPGMRLAGFRGRPIGVAIMVFCAGFVAVVGPWLLRNAYSVGKLALTEEYGSVALIERFAYNSMTPREFALAFPYCVPIVGPAAVNGAFGPEAMRRFQWDDADSFFHVGRSRRMALIAQHGRLDPVIKGIVGSELQNNGSRYVLTILPLAWCGLWVGKLASLFLIPLFAAASVSAIRQWQPLFFLYALPALAMLGLHAAVANHYTRYNLILIGPAAAGGGWILARLAAALAARRRAATA